MSRITNCDTSKDTQPVNDNDVSTGHKLTWFTQASIFAFAAVVAIGCFISTYVLYVCFSESADFAFMIAFGPAGLVAFIIGSGTLSAGLALAERMVGK